MRAWRVAVMVGVLAVGAGCASSKQAARAGEPADPGIGGAGTAGAVGASSDAAGARYVDEELGFSIARPGGGWRMDVSGDYTPEGIATPVVMKNEQHGAQVVIQVAPAVATPIQFAERLTEGMRSHPGFVTSDPEPVPLSDDAVGFKFSMGDRVFGRVAVRDGAEGKVLMMLATWPAGAPDEAWQSVDRIFMSVQPVNRPAGVAQQVPVQRVSR